MEKLVFNSFPGRRPKLTEEEKAVRDENREAKQARKAAKQERKRKALNFYSFSENIS